MNAIEKMMEQLSYTPAERIAAMNWLQDRGIISDNCVSPKDVAPPDDAKAAQALFTGFHQ